jgi:oligopeptide/dipeptide ABC transporter ATP-binding protein
MMNIKGEARSDNEEGCAFQTRCPYKTEICAKLEPRLEKYDEQSFCACHLAGSI